MSELPYRFIDNPNAPEIVAHKLHDIQFFGGLVRLVPVVIRQEGARFIAEPPAVWVLPYQAIQAAAVMAWQKMPPGVILPCTEQMICRALALH